MQQSPRSARFTLLLLMASLVVQVGAPGASATRTRNRDAVLHATNASRGDQDVASVRLQAEVSDLVRKHSLMMARSGDLIHTEDPAKAYLEGIRWTSWGENVGVTGGSVADLQAAFMRSSGHRTNILNARFEHVAVGAVRRDGILWVTVFFWG